jgi:sugar phosphate isomerase/epimerase
MNRRHFTAATAMTACHVLARGAPADEAPAIRPAAELRLGSQEGRLPGQTLKEKVARLAEWGGSGLEPHGNPRARIAEIKEALAGTGVEVSALCWGAADGDLVSPDAGRRKKGIAALEDALATAGELGARGVIFVPCFHKQSGLPPAELDKILFEILPALGEHAVKCGTRVLLEPLNRGETFYLNRLGQAAEICRKLNHPGVCLMGDFYHMSKEESDQTQAFVEAAPWLQHVHLATGPSRILPGQEEHSFVAGFKGLKQIGYRGFCSLECGVRKGSDPVVEIPKAFEFLRRQWREA